MLDSSVESVKAPSNGRAPPWNTGGRRLPRRPRFDLVPTRANGQPAFGAYLRTPSGISHGVGLYVLSLASDRICALTRFENSVLPWFGLPRSPDLGYNAVTRMPLT